MNGTFRLCCESLFGSRAGPREDPDGSFDEHDGSGAAAEDGKGSPMARHGLSTSIEMSSFGGDGRRNLSSDGRSFSLSLASESPAHDVSTAL